MKRYKISRLASRCVPHKKELRISKCCTIYRARLRATLSDAETTDVITSADYLCAPYSWISTSTSELRTQTLCQT